MARKNKSTDHNEVAIRKRCTLFSTMSTEKCSYKWIIECFSRTNASTNAPATSTLFPSEEEEEKCKWILTFYPCGDSCDDYLYLKLTMEKGPELLDGVLADFVLRLKDSRESELCYRRDEFKFSVKSSYSWEQLPRMKHLKEALEDDILVIDLTITSTLEAVNKYHDPEPPISFIRMVDNYAELRKSGKLCDATIIVENRKIPVHSLILAARSPVFMAMFEHSTQEKQSSIVHIEDIDYETIQHLLDFIYSCGLPEFDVPLAMDLFKAADKYHLLDLKEHCANYLSMSLNTSNVAEILLLADMYSARTLKSIAIEYICMDKAQLSRVEGFNTVLREEARVLVDILKKMSVNISQRYLM